MKVVPYCFTLAGCQNPPLPVVDQSRLNTAVERKHLTSSLTEDGSVCLLDPMHELLCYLIPRMMLMKISDNLTTEQMSVLSHASLQHTVVLGFIKMLYFVVNPIKSGLNECQTRVEDCLSGTRLKHPPAHFCILALKRFDNRRLYFLILLQHETLNTAETMCWLIN